MLQRVLHDLHISRRFVVVALGLQYAAAVLAIAPEVAHGILAHAFAELLRISAPRVCLEYLNDSRHVVAHHRVVWDDLARHRSISLKFVSFDFIR